MKLSELIAAYGDDRVKFQNLDTCADTLDWTAKRGTKICFGTEETIGPNGMMKLGLVIWLDRNRVQEIIAAKTTPPPSQEGDAGR